MRHAALLSILALGLSNGLAQGLSINGLEFDAKQGLPVVIEKIRANDLHLTQEGLRKRTEQKLHLAGMTPAKSGEAYLYVNLNLLKGGTYGLSLSFRRTVRFAGAAGFAHTHFGASTWEAGTVGSAERPGEILSELDRLLDQFLTEFKKANPQENC